MIDVHLKMLILLAHTRQSSGHAPALPKRYRFGGVKKGFSSLEMRSLTADIVVGNAISKLPLSIG